MSLIFTKYSRNMASYLTEANDIYQSVFLHDTSWIIWKFILNIRYFFFFFWLMGNLIIYQNNFQLMSNTLKHCLEKAISFLKN